MRTPLALLLAVSFAAPAGARPPAAPLRVVAMTPTIASLVRAVGGDDVAVVTVPAHGSPTAGDAAALAQAQLLVRNGDGAEAAWLVPRLAAVPAALRPGGRAHLDVSRIGPPAECAPFELLDPMRGLALAGALRDVLERLRPARRQAFTEAYEAFRGRLAVAMLGERLGRKYPLERVADLHRSGMLDGFLAAQHESTLLGGWFERLRGTGRGVKAVADRTAWRCFAGRFGIEIVSVWETPHRGRPSRWKEQGAGLVLVGVGDRDAALQAAARRVHVPVAALAGQVGAAPGTDEYLALLDFDVQAVVRALEPRRDAPEPAP